MTHSDSVQLISVYCQITTLIAQLTLVAEVEFVNTTSTTSNRIPGSNSTTTADRKAATLASIPATSKPATFRGYSLADQTTMMTSTSTLSSSSGNTKQLAVGLGMGFGFTFGLIVSVCVIWRITCRLMNSNNSPSSSNKVGPEADFSGTVMAANRQSKSPSKAKEREGARKPQLPSVSKKVIDIDADDLYEDDYVMR